jgi:hypothetical protein
MNIMAAKLIEVTTNPSLIQPKLLLYLALLTAGSAAQQAHVYPRLLFAVLVTTKALLLLFPRPHHLIMVEVLPLAVVGAVYTVGTVVTVTSLVDALLRPRAMLDRPERTCSRASEPCAWRLLLKEEMVSWVETARTVKTFLARFLVVEELPEETIGGVVVGAIPVDQEWCIPRSLMRLIRSEDSEQIFS